MGRVKKEKRSKKLQQKELWEREMRRREEDRKNTEACASTSSRSVHDNARKEWNLRTNTFPSSDTRSFSSPSSSSSSSSSSPSSSSSSSPCLRVSSSSTVHRRHLSLQTQSLRHYHPTMNHCNYQPISHTQAHAASQRPRAVFITPVWPSQSNTAAGVRTWSLFQILQELCYGVVCMSAARYALLFPCLRKHRRFTVTYTLSICTCASRTYTPGLLSLPPLPFSVNTFAHIHIDTYIDQMKSCKVYCSRKEWRPSLCLSTTTPSTPVSRHWIPPSSCMTDLLWRSVKIRVNQPEARVSNYDNEHKTKTIFFVDY